MYWRLFSVVYEIRQRRKTYLGSTIVAWRQDTILYKAKNKLIILDIIMCKQQVAICVAYTDSRSPTVTLKQVTTGFTADEQAQRVTVSL